MEKEKVKRVEKLTDKAFQIYMDTLWRAHVWESSEWECGTLDCDMCPFNHDKDCLKSIRKCYNDWLKWGMGR